MGIVFPDLPGCFSAGDTCDEAIANAHEALRLYADAERGSGRKLPPPSTFEALYSDREIRAEAKGAPFVGIRLDEPARAAAKVRKTPRGKRRQAAR